MTPRTLLRVYYLINCLNTSGSGVGIGIVLTMQSFYYNLHEKPEALFNYFIVPLGGNVIPFCIIFLSTTIALYYYRKLILKFVANAPLVK